MQNSNFSRVTKVVKAKIKAKVEGVILHLNVFRLSKFESLVNLAKFQIAVKSFFQKLIIYLFS